MKRTFAILAIAMSATSFSQVADFQAANQFSFGAGSGLPAPYTSADMAVTYKITVLIGPFPVQQTFSATEALQETAVSKTSGSLSYSLNPQALTPLAPASPALAVTGTTVNASTADWTFNQTYTQTGGWTINQTIQTSTGPVQVNLILNNINVAGKFRSLLAPLASPRTIATLGGAYVQRVGVASGGDTNNFINFVPSSVSGTAAGLTVTALRIEFRSINHVKHFASPRGVRASLTWLDDSISRPDRNVVCTFNNPSTGAILETHSLKANNRVVSIPTWLPAGNYVFRVKSENWLSKSFNVTISATGLVNVTGSLINGDIDGDTEVGPADFDTVVAQFGGTGTADVDSDGEVGPSDFDIVVANFGVSGD